MIFFIAKYRLRRLVETMSNTGLRMLLGVEIPTVIRRSSRVIFSYLYNNQ